MTIADQVHAIRSDVPVRNARHPDEVHPAGRRRDSILAALGLDADGIAGRESAPSL